MTEREWKEAIKNLQKDKAILLEELKASELRENAQLRRIINLTNILNGYLVSKETQDEE